MNNLRSFLIFVVISLTIYTSLNLYIFFRAFRALALSGVGGTALKIAFTLIYLAFPLAMFISKRGVVGKISLWIGSFWLGAMAYGVLIALIIDILILSNYSFHWFPAFVFQNKVQTGRMIFYISGGLVSLALIGGYINSINPVVNRIQLKLGKSLNFKNYTIAVFSDTHLGFIVRKSQLEKIVELTNKQNPDIIFIIGDLSDEPASNIEWAVEPLKRLKASDGVWMVTGNHEFYHGLQGISDLVQRANVNLLRNQAREIEGKINIVGLDDVTGGRQFRQEMPAIVDLVQGLNHNLPTILLHHTPVRRQEAEQAGVDLMLSGHTHAGQLWPFGELAKATYKIVPGLSKIGNMYFYLSVGAGTWGPPIRLGSRSEVVKVVIIN